MYHFDAFIVLFRPGPKSWVSQRKKIMRLFGPDDVLVVLLPFW